MDEGGVIYMIMCSKSDNVYIGSSVIFKKRRLAHLQMLRRKNHPCIHLQRAFNKYGEKSFTFCIVENVAEKNFLLAREQFWIWRWWGNLFNVSMKATAPSGFKKSKKYLDMCRKRMIGNRYRRGQKSADETKSAISKSLIGNKRRKGVPHSEATKKRIRESLKKSYREGRHKRPDPKIYIKHLKHLEEFAKRQRGNKK